MKVRLGVAFALVAVLSVAAVGVAAQWAVQSEFGAYLYRVRSQAEVEPGEPADPPPPGVHGTLMRRMMGPWWVAAMEYATGRPEQAFLSQVQDLLWRVGLVAALAGAGLGVITAWTMSRRTGRLVERALGLARASRWEPPAGGDEIDKLSAAFTTMEQALERKEEDRRRLLTDIAHELRNPLAVVRANLEAMLDGVTPATPERIAAVHTQVALLGRLVNELRDLAMAEAGELLLHEENVDLAQLVEQVGDLWRPGVAEARGRLELDVRRPAVVAGDADRLNQVMANLLSNAVRYLPRDAGVVRIAVGPDANDPDRVRVTVEDNGPGIPEASLSRVFDHFYRADPARSRATGGTGIGLAVVRSVVEAHGGRVWAENRAEGGARLVFTLPAAAGTGPAGGQKGRERKRGTWDTCQPFHAGSPQALPDR